MFWNSSFLQQPSWQMRRNDFIPPSWIKLLFEASCNKSLPAIHHPTFHGIPTSSGLPKKLAESLLVQQ
jgi:hypothetical protein